MFDEEFLKSTLTPMLAIVGAFFGLVGTGLGAWNFFLNRRSHACRLRVELSAVRHIDNELGVSRNPLDKITHFTFHVKCFNDSYFEVSVSEVGVVLKQSFFRKRQFVRCAGPPRTKRIPSRDAIGAMFAASCGSKDSQSKLFELAVDPAKPITNQLAGVYFRISTGHVAVSKRSYREMFTEVEDWAPHYFKTWMVKH